MDDTTRAFVERPTVLFVLGMARSGTSALTRVLSLCGATLPPGMMGADHANQRGYWEPRKSIYLNRDILYRQGSFWWDLSILDSESFDADDRSAATRAITDYLKGLPPAPLVVIKDPQIVPLAELWFDAARQAGFDVSAVIAVRHPDDVSASVQAAACLAPEHATALWLKANLLAERNTRNVSRVFIEYSSLLEDWRREVKRVCSALDVDLEMDDEKSVDEFLTTDLHHQKCNGPVADRFGTKWTSAVYHVMYEAAQDQPLDTLALDGIYESYRASVHDFGVALESQRKRSNNVLTRLLRPSISELIGEALAIVHLRKGTWS